MKYYSHKYKQLDLGLFRSSLSELDKSNRWVVLGDTLPWTELEKEYNSRLQNDTKGAGNKPARMIIGAMMIKHRLNLSDVETIEMIRENPYMQYMCGLSEFTDKPIFDPSLFVTIRKRITEEDINKMSVLMLKKQMQLQEEKRKREEDDARKNGEEPPAPKPENPMASSYTDKQGREHKGVLKIDATCADAEMRYPVDVDIIHDGCRKVSDYIAKVCDTFKLPMPFTYYKRARQAYLHLIKKAKKKGKMVNETILLLLKYLYKDILTALDLIGSDRNYLKCLLPHEKRTLAAICKMYHQQKDMRRSKTHTCADRILSIFQPHVRAIVRGKAKARTEFGAKIGASIVCGYTFIDHHSWNAYNESQDLQLQIRLYKERFGHLPSTILADKIYLNSANLKILQELEIQTYCKPLGRPPKTTPTEEQRSRMAKASGERNEIECSFGTGKRIYRANNIRAKLPNTALCWTGMCYFVKNMMRFLRELCLVLNEIWRVFTSLLTKRGVCDYPRHLAAR